MGHISEISWEDLEKAEVAKSSFGVGRGPVEMGK